MKGFELQHQYFFKWCGLLLKVGSCSTALFLLLYETVFFQIVCTWTDLFKLFRVLKWGMLRDSITRLSTNLTIQILLYCFLICCLRSMFLALCSYAVILLPDITAVYFARFVLLAMTALTHAHVAHFFSFCSFSRVTRVYALTHVLGISESKQLGQTCF